MIIGYVKGLLQMTNTVKALNEIYDKEEVGGIDDMFNLSTDKTEEHYILSIYETLGGMCLVSVKFDKETGKISKSSNQYIYDRFGDYIDESGLDIFNEIEVIEKGIDFDVVSLVALVAGLEYAGTDEHKQWFAGLLKEFQQ